MKRKYKRIDVNDLVIGQEYYIICGIWNGKVIYTHSEIRKSHTYYNFTFGLADNWRNQLNIFSTKSNFRIYKEI